MAKKQSSKQKAKARAEAQKKKQSQRYMFMGLGALLLFGLIGFSVFRNATAPHPLDIGVVDANGESADNGIFLQNYDGSPDAPVQIVEFGDFGCHACRQVHNSGVKAQIIEKYGDQVAFVFRHFPVITRNSPQAAAAGQCASEQNMFWEYHDYIYESTPEGALSSSDMRSYAQTVGLDMSQYDACYDSGKYENYVTRDLRAAQELGARGTPAFFVNGESAIPSVQSLSAQIDTILN